MVGAGSGQVEDDERDQLASVEERFDDHVGWAYRYGMVWNWEVFRCELHAAVMIVCGLDGSDVDPADLAAVEQLGERHRDLELALEQARLVATPTQNWPSYYRALWEHTARAGLIDARPDAPAPLGLVSHDQEPPGIPERMIMWMLRTGFQRAMAEVYRDAPIENWSLLGPILQRELAGAWAVETRWAHHTAQEHRELVATRRQQLQELLATAQQHFDPATHWEAFREYLWLQRYTLESGRPAPTW